LRDEPKERLRRRLSVYILSIVIQIKAPFMQRVYICVVKEFRVRYSFAVVVTEKKRESVKINIEVALIVSWENCL